MRLERRSDHSPALVRWSMAGVFLWFGMSQVLAPKEWTGWLPDYILPLGAPESIVAANGALEIVLGLLLLIGLFTRISASILGLHLLGIAFIIGYNAIGIRDTGLALATIAVALHGPDAFSLDKRVGHSGILFR